MKECRTKMQDVNPTKNANVAGEYLTTDEVAELLRVSAGTVRGLIREGKIPAHQVGRSYRINKADLDAWLESVKVGA